MRRAGFYYISSPGGCTDGRVYTTRCEHLEALRAGGTRLARTEAERRPNRYEHGGTCETVTKFI